MHEKHIHTLQTKIDHLEAENQTLRRLYIETEQALTEMGIRYEQEHQLIKTLTLELAETRAIAQNLRSHK